MAEFHGGKGLGDKFSGSGGALASRPTAKGYLQIYRTPEDTKRWRITWVGRGGCTRDGGQKKTDKTLQDRQGTRLLVKAGRGGSRRVGDGVIQGDECTPGRENTWV